MSLVFRVGLAAGWKRENRITVLGRRPRLLGALNRCNAWAWWVATYVLGVGYITGDKY
jgi:hypothetical protein